jgi:hypothetical protein
MSLAWLEIKSFFFDEGGGFATSAKERGSACQGLAEGLRACPGPGPFRRRRKAVKPSTQVA